MKFNVEIYNPEVALVSGIVRIVHEFEGNRVYFLVAR
jgi:hypothetical protein